MISNYAVIYAFAHCHIHVIFQKITTFSFSVGLSTLSSALLQVCLRARVVSLNQGSTLGFTRFTFKGAIVSKIVEKNHSAGSGSGYNGRFSKVEIL